MTTQHSPGPWTVAAHTAESPDEITPGCDWTVYGADNVSVCFEGAHNQHACANVRLITAAPVLLQELRNIANADTTKWDDRSEFEAWAKSRATAAIAKATGEKL